MNIEFISKGTRVVARQNSPVRVPPESLTPQIRVQDNKYTKRKQTENKKKAREQHEIYRETLYYCLFMFSVRERPMAIEGVSLCARAIGIAYQIRVGVRLA